jgi:hypothetical protein
LIARYRRWKFRNKKKAATASGGRYKEAREGGNLRAATQENGIAKRGISTMMVQVEGIVCAVLRPLLIDLY